MHQPLLSGVMEGQATDIEIEAREMLRLRDRLYHVYADATGQTVEKIEADCDRNLWLDDKEMLEYGIVDEVLENMPKISGSRDPGRVWITHSHPHPPNPGITDTYAKSTLKGS